MLRTTFSASFCMWLLLAGGACSSKSTDDGNKGGSGGILPGSGGSSSGGSSSGGSSSGATTGNPSGGIGSPIGGGATTAGNGGTSSAAQACLDTPLTCVDSETIKRCNPDTLMDETGDCAELLMSLGPGLTSEGCQTVQGRASCTYDFEDMDCAQGAAAFTACFNAANMSNEDMEPFYFDCFSDTKYDLSDAQDGSLVVGAKALITCFNDYIMDNTVDCDAGATACFPDTGMVGAGGAGG